MLKEKEEELTYFYHPDHLGSVSVVSNNKGMPYERVEYLPFGEVWIEDVDPATSYIPFRFTSKELDRETGLYYYGARYYEPRVSRWMSADPAGWELVNPMDEDGEPVPDGWPEGFGPGPSVGMRPDYSVVEAANWYAYVSNNPVKYVDPTGGQQFGFSVKDYISAVLSNSGSGGQLANTAIAAANGDTGAQAMMGELLEGASVEILRQGSDAASIAGTGAAGAAVAAAATGEFHVAGGAAVVGLVADTMALVLSAGADAIEGEFTGATASKAINLGLSLTAKKISPKFNPKSNRFHHSIGPRKGQFATTALGRLFLGGSSAATLGLEAASESMEDKIDELLPNNDRNDQ